MDVRGVWRKPRLGEIRRLREGRRLAPRRGTSVRKAKIWCGVLNALD